MMTHGKELRTGEAESGLGSKRVSGMGIGIEGPQRPYDQRTSGEGAQVRKSSFSKRAVVNCVYLAFAAVKFAVEYSVVSGRK